MNEISKVFQNEEFGDVRVVMIDGEPWFLGKEIASILGYSDANGAVVRWVKNNNIKRLNRGDNVSDTLSNLWTSESDRREKLLINERGLYKLIMRSTLESAERFQDWVTDEVLPSIRKTGSYSLPESDDIILSKALLIAQGRIEKLTTENEVLRAQNEEMQPKAEYYDDLVDTGCASSITETAKEFGMHRKDLVDLLIANKCLYRDKTKYRDLHPYMNCTTAKGGNGMFIVKDCRSTTNKWAGSQAFITVKGKEMIRELLIKQLYLGQIIIPDEEICERKAIILVN